MAVNRNANCSIPKDEQHRRYRDHREPQCGEEERWQMVESHADGEEVETPQENDGQGDHAVTGRHRIIMGCMNTSAQSNCYGSMI
jgi:hypothetical protein